MLLLSIRFSQLRARCFELLLKVCGCCLGIALCRLGFRQLCCGCCCLLLGSQGILPCRRRICLCLLQCARRCRVRRHMISVPRLTGTTALLGGGQVASQLLGCGFCCCCTCFYILHSLLQCLQLLPC